MSSKARSKGMKNARQHIMKNVSGMKPRWLIVLKYFYGLCILRRTREILTLGFLNVNIHVKKGKTKQKTTSTTTSEKLSIVTTDLVIEWLTSKAVLRKMQKYKSDKFSRRL